MTHKIRTEARRFEAGQIVEICSSMRTRFAGQLGEIVQVHQSRYAATLDKYEVRITTMADGVVETFWDIELKQIRNG